MGQQKCGQNNQTDEMGADRAGREGRLRIYSHARMDECPRGISSKRQWNVFSRAESMGTTKDAFTRL